MLNSRDVSLLRADVAANCRKMIELAKADGWPILVTGTVRDEAYQLQCYNNGTSKSKVPTFHGVKAGLAFDICKNVKGQEYSDASFWAYCGALGKRMGFTWGGDWTSFPDKPHFQWDANKQFGNSDILAGRYPPQMPLYEEDDDMAKMTGEEIYIALNEYLSDHEAPEWAKAELQEAVDLGITDGTRPMQLIPRYQAAIMAKRVASK
ncbi:hypothetical protein SDC9_50570 [bioreactor metagenome]|uniref:Peptidase M15C domain-containing protein n=1 Tax=bioreactor metagenome TaxID=1076179 RepID=A0A644WPU0_9ZZZZ